MQSYLIISDDNKTGEQEALKISNEHRIDKFDISISTFEKITGVDDIKEVRKNIFLSPIKSDEKSIIINAPFGITPEAQNSMLKILEEPPPNTLIIIISSNIDIFLPTIISRVKIISFKNKAKTNLDFNLEDIISGNISEKLYFAQQISQDKNECLLWIKETVTELEKELKNNIKNENLKKIAKTLREINKTYSLIKNTNANIRLILENLFLNFN